MDPELFNERPLQERMLLVKEAAEWLCTNECGLHGEHMHVFYWLPGLVIEVHLEFQGLEVQDVRALRYADEEMERLLWSIRLDDLREFTQQGEAPF